MILGRFWKGKNLSDPPPPPHMNLVMCHKTQFIIHVPANARFLYLDPLCTNRVIRPLPKLIPFRPPCPRTNVRIILSFKHNGWPMLYLLYRHHSPIFHKKGGHLNLYTVKGSMVRQSSLLLVKRLGPKNTSGQIFI